VAYDAACGLYASAVRSNLVLRTLVADFSDEGDGFMLPALAALRCILVVSHPCILCLPSRYPQGLSGCRSIEAA
jgi:hypothetical protein